MTSIPPISTDWFQDAFWTGTVTPGITTAQNHYTTAANNVNSYAATYTTSKTTLEGAIAAIDTPPTTQAEVDALVLARDDFDAKQTEYNSRLQTLQNRSVQLIAAYRLAQTHVDDEGDTLLDSYVDQLVTEVGLQLARTGVDTNTLPILLTGANTARNTAKLAFTGALDAYQTAENDLSLAKIQLLALYDQKLLAEADVAYRQGLVDLAQGVLDQAESDLAVAQALLDTLLPSDPGYAAALAARDAAQVVVDNAQAALTTAQTDLATAQAALAVVDGQVTAQETVVSNALSTRDSLKTALDTALTTYTSAINDLLQVLHDAYDLHFGIPQQFMLALQAARDEAATTANSILAAYVQYDQDLQAALLAGFPNEPPPALVQEIQQIRDETTQLIDRVIRTSDASQVTQAISSISVPSLPPPGKSISINDLMRLISAIGLIISRLGLAIRQADNAVDMMRMRVWDAQNAYEVKRQQTLFGWAMTVIQADEDYNVQVGVDNAAKSTAIFNAINDILNNPATQAKIQAAVIQLNLDIDAQNQRGIDITNGLNNSGLIAVDTINQNQQIQPQITNTADIFDEEEDAVAPADLVDPAPFPPPDTIVYYPPFNPGDYTPPANTFPIPAPILDPDPGVQPTDPSAPPVYVPPDVSVLPTQIQIDQLNATVEALNNYLYPIRERLATEGFPFTLIEKFYLRPYTPVRSISDIIDIEGLTQATKVYAAFIEFQQTAREHPELSDKGPALAPFDRSLQRDRVPVTEGQHPSGEPVGTGAGILSANLLASSPKVSRAVQIVIASTDFVNGLSSLVETSSMIAGLQTLTQFPTSIPNYSQLGLVRSDLSKEIGASIDARVQATTTEASKLSETDKLLAKNTAANVIATAGDVNGLKQRVLELIQKAGPLDVSEEELKELISALLYILQLLLLLVAALLLAAAGGTDLETVLTQVFRRPQDFRAEKVLQDLRNLGVTGLDTLRTSDSNFTQNFANALVPLLSASQQASFAAQISAVFTNRGIAVAFDATKADLGTQIANAISQAPTGAQDAIRREIIRAEVENAELYRQDAARAALRHLETRVFGTTSTTGTLPQSTLPTQTPTTTLSNDTKQKITQALNSQGVQIPGLTPQEQNTLAVSVATGLITPTQATTLVSAIVPERISGTDQTLAFLQAQAALQGRLGGGGTGGAAVAPTQPAVLPGKISGQQILSKDPIELLRDAFQVLSNQSDNKNFAESMATSFAKDTETLTNFFEKSLPLILDPGGVFVRNFSIFTMDGSLASRQTNLSVPMGV